MERFVESKEAKNRPFSFNITSTLERKLEEVSKFLKATKSEIARQAITDFVGDVERERRKDRLRSAYDANQAILKEEAEDWDFVNVENLS